MLWKFISTRPDLPGEQQPFLPTIRELAMFKML
jgi:hypothetical protein